ncbi:MAG: AsmA family protein [Candidatus Omnitrophota bacterium]
MKGARKVLIIALVIALGVLLFRNIIAKIAIENGVQFATGLKLRMDSFNIGIFRSKINIAGLRLYNPKGFEDKVMLDIPNIYIDYNLPAILKGKVYLQEVRFNLKEFTVVKNKEGRVNLNYLKPKKEQKEKKAKEDKPKKEKKPLDIKIDNLEVRVDKLVYKDYTKKAAPSIKEFNVNLYEKHTNITNINAVMGIILIKALTKTTISGIASGVSLATDTAAKTTEKITQVGKSLTGAVVKLKDDLTSP